LPETASRRSRRERWGLLRWIDMEGNKITILGETTCRNQSRRFGIKPADRARHVYMIGQTGMGKSTLMLNMLVQDIWDGRGSVLIDPHGDLAEKLLRHIPTKRINDVVYINQKWSPNFGQCVKVAPVL
jgi:hypothetical protein